MKIKKGGLLPREKAAIINLRMHVDNLSAFQKSIDALNPDFEKIIPKKIEKDYKLHSEDHRVVVIENVSTANPKEDALIVQVRVKVYLVRSIMYVHNTNSRPAQVYLYEISQSDILSILKTEHEAPISPRFNHKNNQ